MASDKLTAKLNIETLLDGEPEELDYIRQAIREKREREQTEPWLDAAKRILDVKPSDTLLFKINGMISEPARNKINTMLKSKVPTGTNILLLKEGINVSVLLFDN
ncbi:MAG: hypothetical protein VB078_00385 [Clostridiaceae bacterium]|nr:hypothetical protein [Clostridiaceae bacterium]